MNGRVGVVALGVACLVVVGLVPGLLAQPQGIVTASGARAEATAASRLVPPTSPEWGLSSPIAYNVPGWAFNNRGDGQHDFEFGYAFWSGGSNYFFDKDVYLPSGAVIEGATFYFYDEDAAADLRCVLVRMTYSGDAYPDGTELISRYSSGSGGFQAGYYPLAVPETVRNYDENGMNVYYLGFNPESAGPTAALGFGGITLWYRLQISPAPATATFSDVPTGYWAFRHIEALAASGITAGCGGGNFCPESYVKRSEMAVYLAKALGLHWPDGPAL